MLVLASFVVYNVTENIDPCLRRCDTEVALGILKNIRDNAHAVLAMDAELDVTLQGEAKQDEDTVSAGRPDELGMVIGSLESGDYSIDELRIVIQRYADSTTEEIYSFREI